MPFGLKQAPGWFQMLMNEVFRPFVGRFLVIYLDDIIIYLKNEVEHIGHLEQVFKKLNEAVLQLNLRKCKFFLPELEFLGHRISAEGIKTSPEKIRAMKELPIPRTTKNIQEVMGLF